MSPVEKKACSEAAGEFALAATAISQVATDARLPRVLRLLAMESFNRVQSMQEILSGLARTTQGGGHAA